MQVHKAQEIEHLILVSCDLYLESEYELFS